MATGPTVEKVLDDIADALINSSFYGTPNKVRLNQKTIKDGLVNIGRENSDKILFYEKDVDANLEDLRNGEVEYLGDPILALLAVLNFINASSLLATPASSNAIAIISSCVHEGNSQLTFWFPPAWELVGVVVKVNGS